MAAMFPEGSDESKFTRDGFIVFMTETRKDIQHLTEAVDKLADRITELADRFDSDADELRKSQSGVIELHATQLESARRILALESEKTIMRKEIDDLKLWVVKAKLVGALVGAIGGVLGSLGYFLVGKIWK